MFIDCAFNLLFNYFADANFYIVVAVLDLVELSHLLLYLDKYNEEVFKGLGVKEDKTDPLQRSKRAILPDLRPLDGQRALTDIFK